eukprot:1598866-Rhodomonas_salina.1
MSWSKSQALPETVDAVRSWGGNTHHNWTYMTMICSALLVAELLSELSTEYSDCTEIVVQKGGKPVTGYHRI